MPRVQSARIAGAVYRSAAPGNHCFGALAEVTRPPWLGFVRCRNAFLRPRRLGEARRTLTGRSRQTVSANDRKRKLLLQITGVIPFHRVHHIYTTISDGLANTTIEFLLETPPWRSTRRERR